MTDHEADAALERATDEALALFADDRVPGAAARRGRARGRRPAEGYNPFAEDPFADAATPPAPARAAASPAGDTPGSEDHPATGPVEPPGSGTGHGAEHAPGRRAEEAEHAAPRAVPAGRHRHTGSAWPAARTVAARAADPLDPRVRPLDDCLGHTLAAPLKALTDLPPFDTSAMDGWAVSGPGPWRLPGAGPAAARAEDEAGEPADAGGTDVPDAPGILAGHAPSAALHDGEAIRIATGARIPSGATAVLRSEHGTVRPQGELHAGRHLVQGQDIRPRGQECRSGDELLSAGTPVTPAVLGLAAATGYDELRVVPRPRVEVLVLGDELLREGLPHDGRIRDALGPMLGPWLTALGAEVTATRRLGDDAPALRAALEASDADVVLTTGGTAAGPVDHVHPTLLRLGAELLVDGVAVRPGHPMLLARLAPDRYLVGLPGNPLAAVAGLLTLAAPLLRALAAGPVAEPPRAALTEAVPGHPDDTRLVPVVREDSGWVRPLRFHGPAMLRGLAAADALAVVPPGGADRGTRAELLLLPRRSGAAGGMV
ncbi:molybdopterin molybdotransferase MoeA [Streptomyces cinnamoneus]|uniref:molybdopterin molybdotransferase MoeA n=1 Tax=Streptomyces cinnamoneus TaxID=53446 RepID=UPI000C07EF5D|nr:molybdopterin molybdotransferase MoeA [Streptomyces cinnamoneus]PPT14019.1 molybdopterin molybdenumtransferase MoeA [Streptomyces cinnamoneus]